MRSARANGYIHHEAVAYETAARFYRSRGCEDIADLYLRKGRGCYAAWGADGKVRQLDELHPQLRAEDPPSSPAGTIAAPVEHLELATVVKISQAVSGEFVLETLIEKLMRTALEHAGAQRGLLIDAREGVLRLEAQAVTSGSVPAGRPKRGMNLQLIAQKWKIAPHERQCGDTRGLAPMAGRRDKYVRYCFLAKYCR